MEIDKNMIAGKWLEIKGEIQKTWGQLTSDELEKAKGDVKAITGLIHQKYSAVEADHSKTLSEIFARVAAKKETAVEAVKETLKS